MIYRFMLLLNPIKNILVIYSSIFLRSPISLYHFSRCHFVISSSRLLPVPGYYYNENSFFCTHFFIISTIYIDEDHWISFQTFFVSALLLIVHTWNSSPLRSNLLRLQCTCCTVPTTSGRLLGSNLVWECQWPSSHSLSSPQLSHNHSLWA